MIQNYYAIDYLIDYHINREYFIIKYFGIAWLVQKLNARKCIRNINNNAVQGRSSENYLT